MKYRFTILNVSALVYLGGCIIYTWANYDALSYGEGWGLAYMVGLFLFGATAPVVDLIIQAIFREKHRRNIVGIFTLVVYIVLFMLGK